MATCIEAKRRIYTSLKFEDVVEHFGLLLINLKSQPFQNFTPHSVVDVEGSTASLDRAFSGPGLLCWLLRHLLSEAFKMFQAKICLQKTGFRA